MLALHDFPVPSVELPGLSVEVLEIHTGTAKFDLSLQFLEREGRLEGWFEYDDELFDGRDDRPDGGTFPGVVGSRREEPRTVVSPSCRS